MSLILSGTDGLSDIDGSAATPAVRGTDANTGIFFPAADTIAFAEGGAEVMRINSSGFVGIGTTTPTRALSVVGTWTNTGDYLMDSGSPQFAWSSGDLRFKYGGLGGTEAMRIDSSGNLLVGTTDSPATLLTDGFAGVAISSANWLVASRFNNPAAYFKRENSNGEAVFFLRDATTVGSISVTTTATAFNTSSDYRLKEAIAPMTGALAKVALLKPCTYKWKVDGSDGQGFIAHELAEVVSGCVTGEKDAVDADGNPQYQGIDTSFLVATLTAALQEAHGLIKNLEQRVAALEAV